MLAALFDSSIYYLVQGVVLGLLGVLFVRGTWKRLTAVTAYLIALFLIDGVGRRYVLSQFGFTSREYFYFYFLSDALLALGAFLLLCAFFRRACATQRSLWPSVRFTLTMVFVLVAGISTFTLSRNYGNLFSSFMVEFEQNLYFTCLVLTTMVYILLVRAQTADNQLGLLVTGMGMQFAGPAASYALKVLTPGFDLSAEIVHYLGPLCTVGMLFTWAYAIALYPKTAYVPASGQLAPALAAENEGRR